jgi:hypothetical protein
VFTVSVVLTLELLYSALLACVAVIVLVPAPTIVTVVDEIVATAVLDDENVNAPVLFDDGAVILNETSVPNVFVGIVLSGPIVGDVKTKLTDSANILYVPDTDVGTFLFVLSPTPSRPSPFAPVA